ncbi:MAG: protein kinase [Planctomycetaceae bacterium]
MPASALTDDEAMANRLQEEIDLLCRAEMLMQEPTDIEVPADDVATVLEVSQRYELRERIARAGMGDVYRAYDSRLRREVAVKIIHRRLLRDSRRLDRFRREASVTGQLDHPGVAAIYASGTAPSGRPFHSMRLILGRGLDVCADEMHRRQPDTQRIRQLLRHFISACQTIHYAHKRGILHNDIKPSHIVIGKFGDTVVLDWGEATQLQGTTECTEGAVTVGNLGDCPPGFTLNHVDPDRLSQPPSIATEVFSLGSTLHYLLHGCRRRTSQPVTRLLQRLDRRKRTSLIKICTKAIDPDLRQRYRSAAELAADLQCWLDDRPTNAAPEDGVSKLRRFSRRHALKLMSSGIAIAASSVTVGAISVQRQASDQSRRNEAMSMLASFGAENVSKEIERRWAQLRGAAGDSQLPTLMQNALTSPAGFGELEDWLNRRRSGIVRTGRDKISSLFVLDDNGRQLGRFPRSNKLGFGVERNFAHRSYFHGSAVELPKGKTAAPIRQSAVSPVFVSSTDNCRKIAFSTPIKTSEDKVLGVLVMTIETTDLPVPGTALDDQHRLDVMVVDTRPDWRGHHCSVLRHSNANESSLIDAQASVATTNDPSFVVDPVSNERCLTRTCPVQVQLGPRKTETGLVIAVVSR